MKENNLATKAVEIALKQLQQSYEFKRPRLNRIADFRRLYNGQILPKLRVQFNVPIPVFSGMIDTALADLDDEIIIEYSNQDPADWKAVEKVNAAVKQISQSSRPGANWSKKFREARQEAMITGRGILKFNCESDKGEYKSNLQMVPFEDFFFEPKGGGDLNNHLFCGQKGIWKTKKQLQDEAGGLYDARQVKKLTEPGGNVWKMNSIWDDMTAVSRFKPLGLNADDNNYVGEEMFQFVEWVMTYEGKEWYLLFDAYTGEWIRFEKLKDIHSGNHNPFISFATHEDPKNFASKAFADDLYPVADSIITMFNQDLTNRQKRLLNARAYDKDMFKDVQKLDEAQYRPDALVPVDTKQGTRRISEGIYSFDTPELSGTIDMIDWLERKTGNQVGVTETQQGAAQAASKKVGVTFAELAQVSKRVSFKSRPIVDCANELGIRFFNSLQDYMKKPMAIKLVGEHGIEWDILKRKDLSVEKDFEIMVESQQHRDRLNQIAKDNKIRALEMIAESENVNRKARDEIILREVGDFEDYEVSLLLDPEVETNKEMVAETSEAIQDVILHNRKPMTNYNADSYFVKKILEFTRRHRGTLSDRQFKLLIETVEEHQPIAEQNMMQRAPEVGREKAMAMQEMQQGIEQPAPGQPGQAPIQQMGAGIPLTKKASGEAAGLV